MNKINDHICIKLMIYKPVTDILHQWLSNLEYLHKMFKSMHMQVSHRNECLLLRFLTSTVVLGTVKEYVSIMKQLCVVTYVTP